MATSPERSITESIRDDFLTCRICFEIFTEPRILPCLHTYCFSCIGSHVSSAQADGRTVVCPECREPIAEDLSSLKTNFFINGLTEVTKVKSDRTLSCTACDLRGKSSPAKVKCLDCGDFLCCSCSDGHNASSLTWKHRKIPLEDIKQGTYDDALRQMQKIKCPKHEDKDVEYFCESCSQLVCLTCVLITHRDHRCQTVADAITLRKAGIVSMTETIRENVSTLAEAEENILSTLEATRRNRDEQILDIEELAKKEIAQITAEKATAIKSLKLKTRKKEKKQEKKLEEVQLQKGVLNSSLNFCDNILKKGRNEEILMLEKLIMERLGQLRGLTVEAKKDTTPTPQKQPSEPVAMSTSMKEQTTSDTVPSVVTPNEAVSSEPIADILERFKEAHSSAASSESCKPATVEVKLAKMFISQHESDSKSTHNIKGLAFSSHVGFVLSDKANKTVKIYTAAGVLKKIISMGNMVPFAVAIAGDVIGVIVENYIQLLKETGQHVHKIVIHSKKPNSCYLFSYALAASDEEFIVGNIPDESRLRIYDTAGTLKRLITCFIQFPLAALSITPENHVLLCEWGGACVKVVSRQGLLQTRCRHTLQWKPNSACVSKKGLVFVADYDFGGILVFDSSGKLLLEYSTRPDGIKPTAIALDDQERVVVAGKFGYVGVYDIVQETNL